MARVLLRIFSKNYAIAYVAVLDFQYAQSNSEGVLMDKLHEVGFTFDGVVLNAGAYTHTSVAIADAIAAITAPVVEVHIFPMCIKGKTSDIIPFFLKIVEV